MENVPITFLYPIPGYKKYLISETGRVLNITKKDFLKGSVNPDGYHNYRLSNDDGYIKTEGRHRLMCLVFKNTDLDVRDLVANHLNGVKGDDRLDNLEWTSYVGNTEHAGMMGLTSKCCPISVRDIDTGEITLFGSATAAGRKLKLSKDAILYRLRFGEGRVYPERKQYRIGHDTGEWEVPESIEKSISDYGCNKVVVLKNVTTGEISEFNSLSSVSSKLGYSIGFLSKKINDPDQPLIPGDYLIQWKNDLKEWKIVTDRYIELEKSLNGKFAVALDTSSNKYMVFQSATALADYFKIKNTTMLYRLNSKVKANFDGYVFYYYAEFARSVQLETIECINP